MTLLASLDPYIEEIKLAAIVIGAGALFAGAYHLGGLGPKADLQALKAEDWQTKYQASQVALTAVQGQLKQAQAVSANNSTVIEGLQNDNAKITASWGADRALAQRLLNSSATPASPVMSKTPSGQAAPGASPAPGDGSVASLLANAAAECHRNADQLNALISEITPQL